MADKADQDISQYGHINNMAYYAQTDSNNIVTQVLSVDNSITDGVAYLKNLFGGTWIQTSYNTHGGIHYGPDGKPDGGKQIGYNFAGIGFNYNTTANAFYSPSPYASWILNTSTYLWNPPIPYPTDGQTYYWDELSISWKLFPPIITGSDN